MPKKATPAQKACLDPEHEPSLASLEGGTWEHTCPGCGLVVLFRVPEVPT